jgi:CheY-like chemotaxis protein/signal transduction histidine kinase
MAHSFSLLIESIFLFFFWHTAWFKILAVVTLLSAVLIFHFIRIRKIKNESGDFQRQLLEKNELLVYAGIKEQKANEKVLLAERNKALLMSKLNHEIRTPMNGILGMASLLNDTDMSSEQTEYTNTIISSGQVLLTVINEIMMNDILEYSKIESGKELEAKDIDLANCIEEVFDVFAGKAAKSGIDLLYCIDDNVPQQIVGDVRRIRQILTNLVENAVKNTSKGEIFITVKLVECKDDNRIQLEFQVKDTGSGIPADKKAQLLRNLSSQDTQAAGSSPSGVGLIICKKLVSLMDGTINMESKENEGTIFRFSIKSKAGMKDLRGNGQPEITELENKKVLIIDDNATAADLTRRHLEKMKMIVSSATSAEEAIDILTQVSFDMVITDLTLQGKNGIEAAQHIRKLYPAISIILLNTVNDERHKQCPELFGAVINKPVKTALLQDAILSQLRNNDTSSTAKKKNATQKLSDEFAKQYPLRILLAEDNPVNQKWTTKVLSKLGYQTEVANNGKEVLEVVSSKQYDLILMDVQMPEMDGLEATRMIRACLELQPVVIAMTANVMQGDRQECMQSGMDDYISKPVELNDLVGMLEKWALLIKEKKNSAVYARA